MEKTKVVKVNKESLEFDNGMILSLYHATDCCEEHHLSLGDLTIKDFKNLEFDLNDDNFFERIPGYGIALKPLNGFPIRVPGYGHNNGYYSAQLDLCLNDGKGFLKVFDITNCQHIISD